MSLTNKRRVFVEEYLRCWNASEAARRAEYKCPRMAGSRLMTNDDIQTYIQVRLADLVMCANEVLTRLAGIAREEHIPLSSETIKALQLIGKHHRLFVDVQETKLEHSVSDDVLATISDALDRGYGSDDSNEEAG